jgi:outer membrane protein TolC
VLAAVQLQPGGRGRGWALGTQRCVPAAYRATVVRASHDVENAFADPVQREGEARNVAEDETALGRARDTSEVAYTGGVVSLIEALDADARVLMARDTRAQAQAASAQAAIAAFRALGGGWGYRASQVATRSAAKPCAG